MRLRLALVGALVCAFSGPLAPLRAQTMPREPRVPARLTSVAKVTRGTSIAWRRGDPIPYLARQPGDVVPLVDGRAGRPILDVSDRVGTQREQGLLGLTFSPDGRRMYLYYASADGVNTLEEYPVTGQRDRPVRVAVDRVRTVLTVPHVMPTHNGGQLAFGRDGLLYVGVGDGGGHRGSGPGQVPGGNSQSLDTLLGKILRIDPTPSGDRPYTVPADNPFAGGGVEPDGSGDRGLIWHYGLRNPWRFSFDRATGDLWIGDVGQDHWEEIDVVPGAARGLNFGYPLLEGTHPLESTAAPGTVTPVYELWHRSGNCAVTGGFVYRGKAVPALRGHYLFADYCRGSLKAIRVRHGAVTALARLRLRVPLVSSFGQDPAGEVYVVSQAKGVLRVDPR